MKIGIISDIHANIYAFEQVVKKLYKERIEEVIFLGDIVFFGLYPQECYDLLKTLNVTYCIKGNTDSNIEEFSSFIPVTEYEMKIFKMIEYTDKKISTDCKKEIEKWKIFEKTKIEDKRIIYCHGSPYSFKDKMESDGEDLLKIKEKIADEKVDVIFCGHTHKKENFKINDIDIINFGAVGYPFDKTSKTRFGIIEIEKGIKYIYTELDYEIEKYKKDIRNQNLFWGEDLIFNLEQGLSGRL